LSILEQHLGPPLIYSRYWSNGAQINAPHDTGISKCIISNQKPDTWDDTAIDLGKGPSENVYTVIHDAYMAAVKQFAFKTARITDASTLTKDMDRFIYTPLHGVGYRFFEHLAQSIEVFDHMTVVERQRNPDPGFSTLPFPNPEEPAALDLAIKLAEAKDIKFIIANDPDADRLAVVERVG
jgi:phosphoglucomutase